MVRSSLFFFFLLISPVCVLGQSTKVSGYVSDENNQPMIGATVLLKGSTTGTTTDVNGNYSLELTPLQFSSDTLVFSFVGYASYEVAINKKPIIDHKMEVSSLMMDEFSVTAIGIKKETRQLGYSSTDVSSKQIQESGEFNIANALNSKVAGVQVTATSGSPGSSTTILIRGNKSVSGSNSPLFVIDGVPVDNTYRGSNFTDQSNRIIDVNPDDIEAMTILKGGAASALYGVRAANGAVIITTKSGKEGITLINFTTGVTLDHVNKLPQSQMKYAQGENGNYVQGTRFSWGPMLDTMSYNGDSNDPYNSLGRLVGINDPTATGVPAETYENANSFFKNGLTFNNFLSIQTGNKNSTLYFSFGNTHQNGIVPNTNYNRNSFKLTGKTTLWDILDISASINYINSNADRGQRGSNLSGVMLGLMRAPVSYDLTNGYDDPVDEPLAYTYPDGIQRTYFNSYDNPFWSVNKNRNKTNLNRVISFAEVKLKISKDISILNRLSVDYYSDRLKGYWDPQSNEYKDLGGKVINEEVTQNNINNDFIVSYDSQLSEKWNLSITAGFNYTDLNTYTLTLESYGFIIPGFYDISNTNIINAFADDYLSRQRGYGLYGNATLGFNRFLYLDLIGRNDWLSNLPEQNNNFFYPGASIGYIFTEHFKSKILNFGKLRASIANTGNGAPDNYLTSNYFVQSGTSVQGLVSYYPNGTIGNNDLRPENTVSYEFGMDLRFFTSRLDMDLTYFNSSTYDQIIALPIPTSTGYNSLITNAGQINNWGIEGLLDFEILQQTENKPNRLSWNAGLNFTLIRSMVVSLTEELSNIPLPSYGLASTQSRVIVGQPYGVLFGTRWLRDENQNVLIDENGFPIRDIENGIVGDPNPDFLMGVRNTFNWKNFSLTFLWDFRFGGDMYNGTVAVMKYHGTHESTENRNEPLVFPGVLASNGEVNTIPIMQEDLYTRYGLTYVSEPSVESVSWARLRDLSISYYFSDSLLKKLKLKGASLAITTRNLILFTNYTGIDPETSLSGAANSFGRDYFNSPSTRSYGLRLKIDF